MKAYPNTKEVENATKIQLAKWLRFLPSPGFRHVDNTDFGEKLEYEVLIMNKIHDRFYSLGGWNPKISKRIGWENPECSPDCDIPNCPYTH